ncbi:MAG: SDR family NAD(P)-dependent oxidoreductase, partial [Chitinivibrionales bacterium]|nr:SDR family NAD(P)-dependent oxidoreductase [Chitinivibrionales bacterium]
MDQKKTALVTGASRGIGRAIAQRLSKQKYHVIINFNTSRDEAQKTLEMIQQDGGSGQLYPFDISDRSATIEAVEDINAHYGIDVLVFNAAIRADELLVFMSEEQWDTVLETDLVSFYSVVKPVVKE